MDLRVQLIWGLEDLEDVQVSTSAYQTCLIFFFLLFISPRFFPFGFLTYWYSPIVEMVDMGNIGLLLCKWLSCTSPTQNVKQSGFKPWLGTLCCVLGHNTLLSQCLSLNPGV